MRLDCFTRLSQGWRMNIVYNLSGLTGRTPTSPPPFQEAPKK